jgi:hypothetical protein
VPGELSSLDASTDAITRFEQDNPFAGPKQIPGCDQA